MRSDEISFTIKTRLGKAVDKTSDAELVLRDRIIVSADGELGKCAV
jgi:hypothetical protein